MMWSIYNSFVLDLHVANSFDTVDIQSTHFMTQMMILLAAAPSEEKKGHPLQSQQLSQNASLVVQPITCATSVPNNRRVHRIRARVWFLV